MAIDTSTPGGLEALGKKFLGCCFTLSESDIMDFDKLDNGAIHNVIAGISKECNGVRLYDLPEGIRVDMYYITHEEKLCGDLITLELNDPDYTELLLQFCHMLSVLHKNIDFIAVYNTFQNRLRSFMEKLGYYTVTNLELEKFKGRNAEMMCISPKGFKIIHFLDKLKFYRNLFGNCYTLSENTGHAEFVYLMINTDSALFKIGFSKNPGYRERTLQSQEPTVHLVALWSADKKVERDLHEKYRDKRKRGEWFQLSLTDLKELHQLMEPNLIR